MQVIVEAGMSAGGALQALHHGYGELVGHVRALEVTFRTPKQDVATRWGGHQNHDAVMSPPSAGIRCYGGG